MASQRGDVVLVPFPAADMMSYKARPAVVVSTDAFLANEGRVIVAAITSNVAAHQNDTSHRIADWSGAGLKKPSTVTSWLTCMTPKLIMRRIGAISSEDMLHVDVVLRIAAGL